MDKFRKRMQEKYNLKKKEEHDEERIRYLAAKYSKIVVINPKIRSTYQIQRFSRKYFLPKCDNDISKINKVFLIRIKFTDEHLNKTPTKEVIKEYKEHKPFNPRSIDWETPIRDDEEIFKKIMEETEKETLEDEMVQKVMKETEHKDLGFVDIGVDPMEDPELYATLMESMGIEENKEKPKEEPKEESKEVEKDFEFVLGFDLNEIGKNPRRLIEHKGYKLYLQQKDIDRVMKNYRKIDSNTAEGDRFFQDLRYWKSFCHDMIRF